MSHDRRRYFLFVIVAVLGLPFWATADDVVECWPMPGVFPTFDGHCKLDQDCAVAPHQTDCCGDFHALGINRVELDRFRADEAICESQYPRCGCPSFGIEADDGNHTYSEKDLGVRCELTTVESGRCVTFVIPE